MEGINSQINREVSEKKVSKIDLQQFGIEKDKPIPLYKLVELIRANKDIIVKGVKSKFYWQLKLALFGNPMQYPSGDNWSVVGKHYKPKNEPYKATVTLFLGEKFENIKNSQFDSRFRQPRIEFIFSGDEEDALRETEEYRHNEFVSLDSFTLNKTLIGVRTKKGLGSNPNSSEELVELDSGDFQKLGGIEADYQETVRWMEELTKPDKRFEVPCRTVIELVKEYHLDPTEAKKLVLAIREFGTYMYKEEDLPDGRSHTGACLVYPSKFKNFCRHKFGLENIDTPHYGEKGEDDGGASGYEPYDFYHEVNVFAGKIVIDWTVRQFKDHKDDPFPYIYAVGDTTKFSGQLYKEVGQRTKDNDPYQ